MNDALAPGAPNGSLQRARLAVIICFVINGAFLANWIVRIPDVKAQLHLTDGQLGSALLCVPAGAFVGQVLTGWLLPTWGSRRILTLMALATCAVFPLLGVAPILPALMLALVLFGIGLGGMDVAMNAQAASVECAYGRPLMTSFHGMWSVAGLAAAAVGGFLAGRAIPVGLHFLGVAGVGLLAMAVAYRGLTVERPSLSGAVQTIALPPRALLPLGVLAFSVLLCEGAVGDWSAVYLRERLGSPPALAAAGYVVFSLLMTLGRLSGDWLTQKLGPVRIVRGGGGLVIAGIGLILLSSAPLAAIFGFGLLGAGVACPFPLVISAAARSPQMTAGRAIAAMATVGYTGSLLGPPLIGSVAEVISLRLALGLLGLVGIIMLLIGGVVSTGFVDTP
jgi:MFS family permease